MLIGFPVSTLMAGMLYTGSKALQYLSVPIVTIIKNLSIILIAYGETKVFGGHVTRMMLVSFGMMVVSSVIGAQSDLSLHITQESYSATVTGYFWLISNCIVSSSFVLFMRYTIRNSGAGVVPFKDFDTVLYNNTLSAPIFLLMSLLGADGSLYSFFSYYSDPVNAMERNRFIWSIVLSGFFAFFISFASAWCMRVTNSTTYSMVGALNKLPIAASGMIVFGDPVTVGSVGSILIGFASGILYTVAKLRYDAIQRKCRILPTSVKDDKLESGDESVVTVAMSDIVNSRASRSEETLLLSGANGK